MDPKTTRGYLNNNPGNLDRGEPPWNGEIRDVAQCQNDVQRGELTHGRFCVFVDAPHGIRGLVHNLWAYQRSGWNTINKAIDRWAPPNENNTAAYKSRVAAQTGKGLDDPLDFHDRTQVEPVAEAIMCVECAGMPYSADELKAGFDLAFSI